MRGLIKAAFHQSRRIFAPDYQSFLGGLTPWNPRGNSHRYFQKHKSNSTKLERQSPLEIHRLTLQNWVHKIRIFRARKLSSERAGFPKEKGTRIQEHKSNSTKLERQSPLEIHRLTLQNWVRKIRIFRARKLGSERAGFPKEKGTSIQEHKSNSTKLERQSPLEIHRLTPQNWVRKIRIFRARKLGIERAGFPKEKGTRIQEHKSNSTKLERQSPLEIHRLTPQNWVRKIRIFRTRKLGS